MKSKIRYFWMSALFVLTQACSTNTSSGSYHEVIEKQPTCTEDGVGYVVHDGTHERTDHMVIPALGHKIEMRTVPATCEAVGYDLYYCVRCGEVDHRSNYTAPLGHHFVTYTTEATCHRQGYVESFCSRCGKDEFEPHFIDPISHHYVVVKHVEPTMCGERGYDILECDMCGDQKIENYTAPLDHDFVYSETVDPDCEHEGHDEYVCSRCGEKEIRDVTPHLNHSFRFEVFPATCLAEGYTLYTCVLCGHQEKRDIQPIGDHNYEIHEIPATCEEAKIQKKICSICGVLGEETHIGKPLGHDLIPEEIKGATCTEAAVWKDHCSRCEYISEEYPHGDPLGHDYHHLSLADATCVDPEIVLNICSRCGDVSDPFFYGQPLGHDYIEEVYSEATCEQAEMHRFVCKTCLDVTDPFPVGDALGHDYQPVVLEEATHTTPEKRQDVCTRCGDKKEPYFYGAAEEHDFVRQPDVPSTCTSFGKTNYYRCSGCGYEKYDLINMLPHSFAKTVVEPTCTQPGYTQNDCLFCDHSFRENYVPALGHDLIDHAQKAPGCDEEGHTAYQTCSRCDYSTYQTLPSRGCAHLYRVTNTISPTTSKEGKTIETCSLCGKTRETPISRIDPSTLEEPENNPVKGVANDNEQNALVRIGTMRHMPVHHYYSFYMSQAMRTNGSMPKQALKARVSDVQMDYEAKVGALSKPFANGFFTQQNFTGWGLSWSLVATPVRKTDGSLDQKADELFPLLTDKKPIEREDPDFSKLVSTINAKSVSTPNASNYENDLYYSISATCDVDFYALLHYDIATKSITFATYTVVTKTAVETFARESRDIDNVRAVLPIDSTTYDFTHAISYKTNHPLVPKVADMYWCQTTDAYHERNAAIRYGLNYPFYNEYAPQGYDTVCFESEIVWEEGMSGVGFLYYFEFATANGGNIQRLWGDTGYTLGGAYESNFDGHTHRQILWIRNYFSLSYLNNYPNIYVCIKNNMDRAHKLINCHGWIKIHSALFNVYVFNRYAALHGGYEGTAVASYNNDQLNGYLTVYYSDPHSN